MDAYRLGKLEVHRVARGDYGTVELEETVYAAYQTLMNSNDPMHIRTYRLLERLMRRYCDAGPSKLNSKHQFRPEGRHRAGGREVLVMAFKSYQWRIYGVTVGRTFVGLAHDPHKQNDKPASGMLQNVASRSLELRVEVGG